MAMTPRCRVKKGTPYDSEDRSGTDREWDRQRVGQSESGKLRQRTVGQTESETERDLSDK